MGRSKQTYDELADRLASGDFAEAGELGVFVDRLHSAAGAPSEHSELIAALAAEANKAGADTTSGPSGTPSSNLLSGKWRRRATIGMVLSSVIGKLAMAGTALAVAATGGMAATGNLPAPAQKWVSETASHVGISIPAQRDEAESEDEAADGSVDSTRPAGPTLPANASDRAKAVIATIFAGDPGRGPQFGRSVAATASAGKAGGRSHDASSSATGKQKRNTAKQTHSGKRASARRGRHRN